MAINFKSFHQYSAVIIPEYYRKDVVNYSDFIKGEIHWSFSVESEIEF